MNFDQPEQEMAPKTILVELAGKKVLHEGIQKIENNEEIYIGPLSSCNGFVVPLGMDKGAIIGHIPPIAKKNRVYFEELINLIDTNKDQIKEAYFFYKSPKDTNQKQQDLVQKLADTITQTLKELGIEVVHPLEYEQDNFFVIVNTANKTIKAMPLHASELTKSKNTIPLEIEYN